MMTDATTLRPTPSLRAVLKAQGRLMARTHGLAAGVVGLLVAVMIGLMGRSAALGELSSRAALSIFLARSWGPLLVVCLFWSLLVSFRGETPSRRGYHWSLPVRRPAHQLARLAAGWAWLVAAVAGGLALGWVAAAVIAGGLPPGPPTVFAAALLALTVYYALGSVVALLSDHPLWWILGIWVGFAALSALAAARGWTTVTELLEGVLTQGTLSLAAAAGAPEAIVGVTRGIARTAHPWTAVLLWTAVALAAMVAAAFVRQERSAGTG